MFIFDDNTWSHWVPFLKSVVSNVCFDLIQKLFTFLLFVTKYELHLFKNDKEWPNVHEEKVGGDGWSSSLVNSMASDLSCPAEEEESKHELVGLAVEW